MHAPPRRVQGAKRPGGKGPFPGAATYDQVLKCSNVFNLLDSRGAISVTERVGVIGRVRKLAVGTAQAWNDQQIVVNTPAEVVAMSALPFLLEIGCEEIPDWMIVPALENLKQLFEGLGVGAVSRVDATPRRLFCGRMNCSTGSRIRKSLSWVPRSRLERMRPGDSGRKWA